MKSVKYTTDSCLIAATICDGIFNYNFFPLVRSNWENTSYYTKQMHCLIVRVVGTIPIYPNSRFISTSDDGR